MGGHEICQCERDLIPCGFMYRADEACKVLEAGWVLNDLVNQVFSGNTITGFSKVIVRIVLHFLD